MSTVETYFLDLLKTSIALFVIVDPIGLVPFFYGLTEDMSRPEKLKTFRTITYTGSALLLVFALVGQQILLLIGISLQSFMIAGGMLLLLVSLEILLRGERVHKGVKGEDMGIVPIAFPLLVGPGAITTTMISLQSFGPEVTVPSILIVMGLTWVVLRLTDRIHSVLGRTGSAVIARMMAVFIAAIAIQFILAGIQFYYPPR